MWKKFLWISGVALVLSGCNNTDEEPEEDEVEQRENETENETDEESGEEIEDPDEEVTEEEVTEEEVKEPDDNDFDVDIGNMTEEEFDAYIESLDIPGLEGDGEMPTDEEFMAEIEAAREASFHSGERGSGINPASIGETVTREVSMVDLQAVLENPSGDHPSYSGTLELTVRGLIDGEEAWDILMQNSTNEMLLDEPTDFNYLLVDMEVSLVEGEESIDLLVPSDLTISDYDGNSLLDFPTFAMIDNPLSDIETTGGFISVGETLTGYLVTIEPHDTDFMLELQYGVSEEGLLQYAYFELD